jgi:hypothetical protein
MPLTRLDWRALAGATQLGQVQGVGDVARQGGWFICRAAPFGGGAVKLHSRHEAAQPWCVAVLPTQQP